MNNNANPMKIRFPASSAVLEPDKDELLSATDSGDLRVETRRAPCGVEYVVERDAKEEMSRAAATLGSAVPIEARRRGGAKGGLSRSEAKLAAVVRNIALSDGRTPTTPDGIARLPLRKALEGIFGKPLPKDGPVAKLVHKMSSGAVVRRAWPLVAPNVPPDRNEEIAGLVEALARVLDSLRDAKHDPPQ